MEILFALMAVMVGGLALGGSNDTDDDAAPTDTLTTVEDEAGNLYIQADDSSSELGENDLLDYIESSEELAALPSIDDYDDEYDLNLGIALGDGDDTLDVGAVEPSFILGEGGDDHIIAQPPGGQSSPALELIDGGDGDDTIDVFLAGPNVTVVGGGGDDYILSDSSWDQGGGEIEGGTGNDTIISGILTDVEGGEGDDLIIADAYRSVLDGGSGDDDITGVSTEATLIGGEGDDTLTIDNTRLDDTDHDYPTAFLPENLNAELTGGDGSDSFVIDTLGHTSGSVTITDFNAAEDVLHVSFDVDEQSSDPAQTTGGFTFVEASESGADIVLEFERTYEDADGDPSTGTITILLTGAASEIDPDMLTVTHTASGVAVALDQTAAA